MNLDLCTNYLTEAGQPVAPGAIGEFVGGSDLMASANAMNHQRVSRRDDLISLTYLLIMMVQGHLPFTKALFGGTDR